MSTEAPTAPLTREDQESKRVKRHHERFQWPLAGAWVLLMLEAVLHRPRKGVAA